MAEPISWTHTRVAMTNFMNLLACKKCEQRPTEPIRLQTCEHLFCHNCIYSESKCFVCEIPFRPSDIRHDFITADIVSACDTIVDIIFNDDGDDDDDVEEEGESEKETQIERQQPEKLEELTENNIETVKEQEIEEQIEFKEQKEMEKENKIRTRRQKKPQIDITRYRNTEKRNINKHKEIDGEQITCQKDLEPDIDCNTLLQNDLLSSTKLTKSIHNTRSKNTILSNIIEETPSSTETEKVQNSIDDTVILNESDGLESMRNTGFNESKIMKAKTSKRTKNRRESKLSKIPKIPQIPKNFNRKNKKGETLLHQACIKKQEDTVEMLLNNGANPNTKDNANWTPLQEAVTLGYYRICELLLEKGASPNTPGIDNKTALHEAVINNRVKETELLLRFDANPYVFDQNGKRPIDYCQSDEIKKLLSKETSLNDSRDLNCSLSSSFIATANKIVVLANNLQQSTKESLSELAMKHKFKIVNSFQSNVTHVVVESDQTIFLNYDLLLSVLHGKWILSSEWIAIGLSPECKNLKEMDLDIFEMKFYTNEETPKRARINAELQNPKLFNNCSFYFALNSNDTYPVGQMELSKKNLVHLCLEGGGCSLSREPNPEGITDQRIPFHIVDNIDHPLHNCSHYIIYSPGKDEPRVKYNMPHIKTLPLVWFIECIEKFTLVDPALFGII